MQLFRQSLAAVLCFTLLSPTLPVVAQAPATSSGQLHTGAAVRPADKSKEVQGNDARILHALDRFAFGPRPGDFEAVRTMGLDRWFEQQLHPASFDKSGLNARLAWFPAMQGSPADLLFRFPSNAIIRQTMEGKLPIPEKGALHSIYENQIYRVAARKQVLDLKKAGSQDETVAASEVLTNNGDSMGTSPAMSADSEMAPTTRRAASYQNNIGSSRATSAQAPVDGPQLSLFLSLPPQQRVSRLIAMQQPEFDNFFRALRPLQRAALLADLTPDLKEVVLALENPQRFVNEELIGQRLTRDIYSPAQLQEVMTDFWLNHFNIFLHKNDEMSYLLVGYERDVIRPLALGKFEDLLEATAHSPAMMLYLDNASSIGPDSLAAQRSKFVVARRPNAKIKSREGLNENYARELMELHTLGVNGGYTQADVTQVARILTGWTVDRPQRGGGFRFEPNRHEPGTKQVLGKKFKENGEQEGRDLLHMLATRPATAQFISRKLAVRFVSDDPPQAIVDRLAKSYLSSNGDISIVLRTLFHSPEFWSADAYRAKVKTPVEFVVSAARAGNADIENFRPLANAIREMGMPLYGCVTPNGYSWQAETWVSTNALVNRMNFALSLAANRLPGIRVAWENSDRNVPASSASDLSTEAEEARLESVLIIGGVSDTTRSAVLQQFQMQSAQAEDGALVISTAVAERPRYRAEPVSPLERKDQLLAGLLLGSPEFQRR